MAHIFTPALRRPLSKPFAKSGTRTLIQRAIASLRARGSDAHLWLPGVGTVSGLTTSNYLESTGNTLATVDNPTGLVLDALGSVSATELVSNAGGPFVNTDGWSSSASWPAALNLVSGKLQVSYTSSTFGRVVSSPISFVIGKTYVVDSFCSATGGAGVITIAINNAGGGDVAIAVISGTRTQMRFVATATTHYVVLQLGSSSTTLSITNISVREVSGIHLTQGTTANKPVLRRGAYNLLVQSENMTVAPWLGSGAAGSRSVGTAPDGSDSFKLVFTPADTASRIIQNPAPNFGLGTFSFYAKTVSGGATTVRTQVGSTGEIKTITDSWTRFSTTGVTNGSELYIRTNNAGDSADILVWHPQLETGSTASDYSPTTTAAASNPDAGRYSWAFDGSNDSLLTGNLGITNACTIVIAGRLDYLNAFNSLLVGNIGGLLLTVRGAGSIHFEQASTAGLTSTAAGEIVAGTPFVLTFRLSTGIGIIRKNGVQKSLGPFAGSFDVTGGTFIGYSPGAAFTGAIGNVLALPVALTDAECLLVERMAASQFPNGPVF